MAEQQVQLVEHLIKISAPADTVYRMIAGTADWPHLFPPTIHVEHLEREESYERIRIWTLAGEQVRDWIARQEFRPEQRRILFRQEVPAPPVALMAGSWTVEALSWTETRVRLRHEFVAVDDDPASIRWIASMVERNSGIDLAALRHTAEFAIQQQDLLLALDDTVQISGSARAAYTFLHDVESWPERLAHVTRVEVAEGPAGVQTLEVDTLTNDGPIHAGKFIRLCFPYVRIIYKQTNLTALIASHTGQWLLKENAEGVAVTARHQVVIEPSAIARVLGDQAGLADARACIRDALSADSLATLTLAKQFVEQSAAKS